MGQVSLTGNDTISIGSRTGGSIIITAFPDGDNAELTFPNDLTTVKTGKNGNSIYALNSSGIQSQLVLRVLRGTADHKFLLSIQAAYLANPPGFLLLTSKVVKRIGDGRGNIASDTYNLSGGVPTKIPGTTSNVGGDENQAIAVLSAAFSGTPIWAMPLASSSMALGSSAFSVVSRASRAASAAAGLASLAISSGSHHFQSSSGRS